MTARTFAALLLFLFSPAVMADLSAAGHLAQLLSSVKHYQAQFNQQVFDDGGELVDEYAGHVAISRPRSLRWDTHEPFVQSIVLFDDLYSQYDSDVEQLIVQTASQSMTALPDVLLGGDSALIDNSFSVSQRSDDETEVFTLVPREATGDAQEQPVFASLELSFRDGQLQRIQLSDEFGQRSVFTFSAISNELIDAAHYTLDVPPETEVIRQ